MVEGGKIACVTREFSVQHKHMKDIETETGTDTDALKKPLAFTATLNSLN